MLNWEAAFRVVAHEIRTPAGAIAGYARLLEGGRLDDAGRNDALRNVGRAAGHLGDLAQQASDLATWLSPRTDLPPQWLPINAIIDHAALRAATPDRVHVMRDPSTSAWQVCTREPRALSVALAAVIDMTVRQQAPGTDACVAVRPTDAAGWCDIVVGPSERMSSAHDWTERGNGTFNLEGGGMGLRLLLGAVVLDAHGAQLWTSDDHHGLTGVRIPVGAGG
jgi:K+-sensing histidine kinase KdpD